MPAKDVVYELTAVDAMPEREYRSSQLEEAVQTIKAQGEAGKPYIIARYKNRTAASAAANTLRKRHGQPDAEGFKFECHRIDDRSALFVVFDASLVTADGVARHEAELAEDKATKAEQARVRREKKKAEAAEASTTADQSTAGDSAPAKAKQKAS